MFSQANALGGAHLPPHSFHTPVDETGRQCQVQPSGSRSAPTCCVFLPVLLFVVRVFVASFAKVPMMSVTWQTQSSFPSFERYSAQALHSSHAVFLASSGMPGPLAPGTLGLSPRVVPAAGGAKIAAAKRNARVG